VLKHITVGLLIPYCVFLFFFFKKKSHVESKTLAKLPFIFLLCAVWSFLPSIIARLPLGFLGRIINNFFVSNIFFFYGILRKFKNSGSTYGLGVIFVIFFSLFFIFAHHLYLQEKKIRNLKENK